MSKERFRCFVVGSHHGATEKFAVFVEIPELDITQLQGRRFENLTSDMAYGIEWLVSAAYRLGIRHGEADEKKRLADLLGLNAEPVGEMPYEFTRLAEDVKEGTVRARPSK